MNQNLRFPGARLFFSALFLVPFFLRAQNVNVSGAVTGNGIYPDLGSAFTAINSGAQTNATIFISILGNTTEAATATLNQGSWSSVTIAPAGGSARSISGAIAGPLIDLNGADHVLIDGLNTGGNSLTIENTSTGAASTIRFINDAHVIAVQNCTLLGATSSTTTGTLFFSAGSVTGNDTIGISTCTIDASGSNFPTNGIYASGAAGMENSTVTLSGCNIANFFNAGSVSCGLLVGPNNTDWTITNNRFYQSAGRTYTSGNIHRAIQVTSGNNYTITSNVIGYAGAAATGVYTMGGTIATRFIGIDLAVGTAAPSSVQGNIITAIALNTSSSAATTNGVLCGINITAGSVNVGDLTGNTIGGGTGVNLLAAVPTASGGMVVGINSSSSGTIVIRNNTIGGLSSSGSTPAVAGGCSGIIVSGSAASMTIMNNTIGNGTTDNMRGGTSGLTTGSSLVSGINLPSTPSGTIVISGNTIQNLASYGTGSSGYVRGIWTAAATGNTSTYSITGNVITNLVCSSSLATIASGQAAAVGINLSVGTNGAVANNAISNIALTNTGTAGSFAVGITHGNSTAATISGNLISNVTNASTSVSTTAPGVAAGIVIRSGTTSVTLFNNMITLGSGSSDNTAYVGIMGNHGSTPDPTDRVYHNTVNIAGTSIGAQPSFCFYRGDFSGSTRTAAVDVRDNIFTNNRSGGTGGHYAIANNYGATANTIGWGTNASNYNVLNAAAATVGYWGGSMTFSAWQSASASDANSFSGITVTYVNPASNLHLNMGTTPTVIESGAQAIAGITSDIDGDVRPGPAASVNGGGVYPDIGADEFDGVPLDVVPPVITYTPLTFTCDTNIRLLTVTITDLSGVPLSGTLKPRIYFRKNANSWVSAQGTLTSGNATNGTWSFPITASLMGGLAINDVVSYFVIAQDVVATPNIASNPSAGLAATDVNNVTTAPSAPNAYTISPTLSGTYTVGASGVYSTLTQAVNAYNTSCLGGPVTFLLTDASYSAAETFPVSINANPDASAVNTLTIKPQNAGTVISGSATAILKLNDADYVTIDGSAGSVSNSPCSPAVSASRDLAISNTSTSSATAVIWLSSTGTGTGASHNVIRNCILSNGVDQSVTGTDNYDIVSCGATITTFPPPDGAGNDSNLVENNALVKANWGIYLRGSALSPNSGNVVRQNLVGPGAFGPNQLRKGGIILQHQSGATVSYNEVRFVGNAITQSVSGSDHVGIGMGGADGPSPSATIVTNTIVSNNTVHDIVCEKTFSALGIVVAAANASATNNVIANNFIYNVHSNSTSPDQGISIDVSSGNGDQVVFNTVSMTAADRDPASATSASESDIGLRMQSAALNPVVANNIFNIDEGSNTASLRNFAMVAPSGYTFGTGYCNYNDYYVNPANPQVVLFGLGTTGTITPVTTLAAWQSTFTPAQDASSLVVQPVFVSATDLHLVAAGNAALNDAGTPIAGITADIECETRNTTSPVIGADEFCSLVVSIVAQTNVSCNGGSNGSATLSVTGANNSVTYSWAPSGGSSATASNLTAGSYSCTITDAIGCTATQTVQVTEPAALAATIASTSVLCNGDATGSAIITVTGGAGGYQYAWSPAGGTNDTASGLAAGTYTCLVTDTNNCQFTETVTITEPTALTLTIVSTNVSCYGSCDGTAAANVTGGTPPYILAWVPGNLTSSSLAGLCAGTYTCTVTDANGCSISQSVVISEPAPLIANDSQTDVTCNGGTDGSASVNVTGGDGNYMYSWSPVGGNGPAATNLAAGSYTCTITDGSTCTITATFLITEPAPVTATLAFAPDTVCLNGGLFTLTGESPAGGAWSGPGVSGNTFDPLSVGVGQYLITYAYTDTSGCTGSANDTLWVDACNNVAMFQSTGAFTLYPNPGAGDFFVELPQQAALEIRDMPGQVVYSRELAEGRSALHAPELANGVYLVRVMYANGKTDEQRLLIQR